MTRSTVVFASGQLLTGAVWAPQIAALAPDHDLIIADHTLDDTIAGSVAKFEMHGKTGITYWLDRQFWGKGVTTTALKMLLAMEPTRPIFGWVAFDNVGSQRVLEKCGFVKIGTDKGFANARQMEIEEFIYQLT